jgi:hypothetical protein
MVSSGHLNVEGAAVTVVSGETVVQRPPGEVFDFVARNHFQNHPKWDRDLLEMTQTTPGPVGLGTTARVVRRQGGRRVEGTATVTAYEPDRVAAWDVRFGPFLLRQRSEYEAEQEGSATRLRLTVETRARGPITLLLPLMRGRFRKTIDNSLRNIGTMIEGSGGSRRG